MNGRGAVIGLSLLCALLFSAIAVPSASANTHTAYTCVSSEAEKGEFNDSDCTSKNSQNKGSFNVKEIKIDETTKIEGTGTQSSVLKSTIAGMSVTITCTGTSMAGDVKNFTNSGRMKIAGDAKLTFTSCKLEGTIVTVGKCALGKETIEAENTSTESVEGAMTRAYKPAEESTENAFASFSLIGCIKKELNEKVWTFTGGFKAIPNGTIMETTVESTEGKGKTEESNGLWLAGEKASFTSGVTNRMEKKGDTNEPGVLDTTIT